MFEAVGLVAVPLDGMLMGGAAVSFSPVAFILIDVDGFDLKKIGVAQTQVVFDRQDKDIYGKESHRFT